ncbi:hypothetical protein K438DRAFT_1763395 [Mycena galopus ATCC 62051]|nr:hypothetical protein K438DRAFT_1763395 [Mycena galopus ATCC 62051]
MGDQATISPIFYLSNELLEVIAAAGQCADFDTECADFHPEWTLSHTSSRLRQGVIGAPALWTHVEADLELDGSVQVAKLYLERSRGRKISVNLHYDQCLPPGTDAENAPIIARFRQIALPQIHRVWRLSIVLHAEWADLLLPPLRNVAAPSLEHLELSNEVGVYRGGSGRYVELFLPGAPRLVFVKLVGFLPYPAVPPWMAYVKHLELGQADAYFVPMAKRWSSLVHLYLDMNEIREMEAQACMPSLKSLHITIQDGRGAGFLTSMVDLFDTPALTEFIIDNAHGAQISPLLAATSLPQGSSFPALASLTFINCHGCKCEQYRQLSDTISAPPPLFPALSALTLINQCFTANLVRDILGPHSQPWPLLETVTLCPLESALEAVGVSLRIAVVSKQQRGETLPKLRLAPALAALENWQELGAQMKIFDPADMLDAFRSP